MSMSRADHNYSYVRSKMMLAYALADTDREGGRLLDHKDDLEQYIEEIGAKVKMRMRNAQEDADDSGYSKSYLDVQMKPHEVQKYKQGRLKFGRLVVSITGQGWVDANPTVFYDDKHLLEHPLVVTPVGRDSFSVNYLGTTRNYQYPFPKAQTLRKRFYTRAVLSDTALDSLGEVVAEMKNQVDVDKDSYCFINHGDDMLSCEQMDGKIRWTEGDIAGNDGCHVDPTFRQLYLMDRFRGEDVITAYAQLAYPVRFQNPMAAEEFMFARYRHGMRLISGSVATTYANCNRSLETGFAHAFYGGSFTEAASRIGVDVTSVTGKITDVGFLSKIFYHGANGEMCAALDHASILRKFGRVAGDVGGSPKVSTISQRMVDHSIGVVKGHVGEPKSLLIRSLRMRYNDKGGRLGSVKRAFKAFHQYTESDLNSHDVGALLHYYGEEEMQQGIRDYLVLVNQIRKMQLYGSTVFSRYVDTTMRVRYAMAPAVVDE